MQLVSDDDKNSFFFYFQKDEAPTHYGVHLKQFLVNVLPQKWLLEEEKRISCDLMRFVSCGLLLVLPKRNNFLNKISKFKS